MSALGRATTWLRNVVRRKRTDDEMHKEMRAHLDASVERLMARGMSAADATREARLEFGNPAVIQENARDERGGQWVNNVRNDMKYAFRYFARTKLTTGAILFTLTLGIGITASMMSIGAAILLRPAPGVPDDAALVLIRGKLLRAGEGANRPFSWPETEAYSQLNTTFAEVAAWKTSDVVADFGDSQNAVQSARAQFVTPNYFRLLDVHLAAGPGFVQSAFADHSNAELTAVVSSSLALQKFGTVGAAMGRQMKLNGVVVTIVGVAPPRFNGALQSAAQRTIWLPVSALPVIDGAPADVFTNRDSSYFRAIARLQPGIGRADATPVAHSIALRSQISLTPSRRQLPYATDVVALKGIAEHDTPSEDIILTVTVFGTMLILVLLLCTTTVSSLLVGLGVMRRHEIAIRRSLGASRARIVRQLLTENVLISLTAAALGLVVYAVICRVLSQQIVDVDIAPSVTTAFATAAYAIVVAILCGLSPALHATRADLSSVLKDASSGSTAKSRLQRAFVVAQIAVSQPMLLGVAIGAVLAAHEVSGDAKGTARDRVVVAEMDVWNNYNAERNVAAVNELVPALSGLPGVIAALPTSQGNAIFSIEPKTDNSTGGAAAQNNTFRVSATATAAQYFNRVGIAVVKGREFTDVDATAPVPPIILSSDAATRLFGTANPIGRRLFRVVAGRRDKEVEVIGVVPSPPGNAMGNSSVLTAYTPLSVTDKNTIVSKLIIRTVGPAEPLIPAIRSVFNQRAPRIPIASIKTLAQIEAQEREALMQSSVAAAGAGILTLFLGAIGLYAVVALGVAQRRREIGIRMALGAKPRQVIGMFFTSGVRLSLIGMFIGLPLSAAAVWAITNQVGIGRFNLPLISFAVGTGVVVIAAVATWLPARRAATVDPLLALRTE